MDNQVNTKSNGVRVIAFKNKTSSTVSRCCETASYTHFKHRDASPWGHFSNDHSTCITKKVVRLKVIPGMCCHFPPKKSPIPRDVGPLGVKHGWALTTGKTRFCSFCRLRYCFVVLLGLILTHSDPSWCCRQYAAQMLCCIWKACSVPSKRCFHNCSLVCWVSTK